MALPWRAYFQLSGLSVPLLVCYSNQHVIVKQNDHFCLALDSRGEFCACSDTMNRSTVLWDNLDGSQNIKPTWPPPHTTPPQKDGDRITSHASALFEITLWLSHIPRSNHSGVFRSTHVGFCFVSWWSRQRHQWGHAWRGRPEFNNRLGPIGCLGNTTLLISFWAQAKVLSLKG